ncbi:MAG: PocR ligand-binding domain-containing protein [Thermodesulfovibrionales bacterium]
MELTDIMPVEEWKRLAEDIHIRFGFNGAVYDKNNNVFAKSEGWANKLCPSTKAGDSRIACAAAQQWCSKEVKEKKETAVVECDAGLIKFGVPIFIDGALIGMVGGCGCLLGDTELDAFYIGKLLKREEEIKDLLITVPCVSQDKVTEA